MSNTPKKKMSKADKFWSTFLFTQDGKPKSGFSVNSLFLSFLFIAVYVGLFCVATELQNQLNWSNFVTALSASAAGCIVCCLTFLFFKDKRYVLGAYLWIALFAVVCLVTMLILLAGEEGVAEFMTVFGWFVLLPAGLGTAVAVLQYRLWRRGHAPKTEDEPEWKKYIKPRE